MVSKEVGHHISESKLSKDFKALNIKRVKEGDRWIYKEIIPVVSDEYSVEFYNYICKKPLILHNLECLHIPVIIGSETLVCKKIINHFGRKKRIFSAYRDMLAFVYSIKERHKVQKQNRNKIFLKKSKK